MNTGDAPKEPLIFLKPSTSVIGPGDAIRIPAGSTNVHHEVELAVVIGARGARQVRPEQAMASVFGYTIGNDVTERDMQRSDGQWTRAINSRRRRRRSHASSRRDTRTARSPRSSSSVRARSSTTCARCSASSA